MKKYVLRTFVLSLLFILGVNQAYAFYSDVPANSPYYNSIKALYDLNLLSQKDDKFRPDESLKNSDLYQLILTFSQAKISATPQLPYSDTPNTAAYAPYLQTAINLGFLTPTGTNQAFEPNKQLTKSKTLEIMFKSLGVGLNFFFDRSTFPFSDLDKNSNLAAIAEEAYALNILETATPKLFKTAKRITRAEAADYLYKIYEAESSKNSVSVTVTPIKTTQSNTDNSYNFSKTEKALIENDTFGDLLDVWSTLKTKYLYTDQIDDSSLIFGAIKGMVQEANDTYTVFEKPTEESVIDSLTSEYEGIGISIDSVDGNFIVISPFKDSPAEKAGMQPGDIITKIDGKSTKDSTLEDVMKQIKGASGTKVEITVERAQKELTFSITRDFIMYKTVDYKFIPRTNKNIAYIEIMSFNDKTYDEFLSAAKAVIAGKPDGLIIDLRNNPGGYMDVAINIISLFTNQKKTAVKLEFSDNSVEEYKTDGNGLLKDIGPIMILINKGSASASEILAGALKDYKLAKLVGETSFGKGTVQELAEYKDGSVFKYTTAHWLTPNGTSINKKGLTPDKTVINYGKADTQLNMALAQF